MTLLENFIIPAELATGICTVNADLAPEKMRVNPYVMNGLSNPYHLDESTLL